MPDLQATAARGASADLVGPYLAEQLGDEAWRDCTVDLISGGRSNLTYLVTSAAGVRVLRRPPLGGVLATAHDMSREYRVMTALADTPVPVPATSLMCTDEDLIGAPFYVMERVEGHVVRGVLPPGLAETAAERASLSDAMITVLAAIHSVPITGELEGFGRPAGFLDRQVRRWTRQWEASKEAELPDLDRLAASLGDTIPVSGAPSLVHGDYKIDNTLLDAARPSWIAAVLDWELSTLGDPLADLGLMLVYWAESDQDATAGFIPTVTQLPGFASRDEMIENYARQSGRDVSALPWYLAFGYFKLAVIAAGVAARGRAGAMIGDGFTEADRVVQPLIAAGLGVLAGRRS
jgi:aminoglycoside phosphotransferase (APT) family kinase protein